MVMIHKNNVNSSLKQRTMKSVFQYLLTSCQLFGQKSIKKHMFTDSNDMHRVPSLIFV
jgi:hypothetical protein